MVTYVRNTISNVCIENKRRKKSFVRHWEPYWCFIYSFLHEKLVFASQGFFVDYFHKHKLRNLRDFTSFSSQLISKLFITPILKVEKSVRIWKCFVSVVVYVFAFHWDRLSTSKLIKFFLICYTCILGHYWAMTFLHIIPYQLTSKQLWFLWIFKQYTISQANQDIKHQT